ncbi:MAG TPA: hypothetical protein VIL99_07110 [Ignavibacteria bacterium]
MAEAYEPTQKVMNDEFTGVDDLQSRINTLMRHDTEIKQIKQFIISKHIEKLDREGSSILLKAAFPSFLLLLLSFFVDVSSVPVLGKVAQNFASWIFPGTTWLNQNVEPIRFWWLPVILYIIFVLCAYLANRSLKKEVMTKGASENIISRIVERYSGIVDGLGTALPLLGAAFLLVSIKEGPTLFIGFSVPFEVKSIIILAIARLFNSVFETQALRYSEVYEDLKKVETEYYYEQQESLQNSMIDELKVMNTNVEKGLIQPELKGISKEDADQVYKLVKMTHDITANFTNNVSNLKAAVSDLNTSKLFDSGSIEQAQTLANTISNISGVIQKSTEYSSILRENLDSVRKIVVDINSVKLPDEKVMKELQITAHFLSETMNNMKDTNAVKSLDNLVYLAGKR